MWNPFVCGTFTLTVAFMQTAKLVKKTLKKKIDNANLFDLQ